MSLTLIGPRVSASKAVAGGVLMLDIDSIEWLSSTTQFSGAISDWRLWACRRISWRDSIVFFLWFWGSSSEIDAMLGSLSRNWLVVEEEAARSPDDDKVTDSCLEEIRSFVPAFTVPEDSRNRIWRVPLGVLTLYGEMSVRIALLNWRE